MQEIYKNTNVFLTGFMGSGKTTVGELLSKKLNKKFFDLDAMIEKYLEQSISDVLEKFGEEYFRKIENQQLAMLCKEHDAVIALGGGSLIQEKNQTQIKKSGLLVYLMADEYTLMNRLEKSHSRPLLKKGFTALIEERKFGYMKANFFIKTDDLAPEVIAERIEKEIDRL
jgi:shikimate kinase